MIETFILYQAARETGALQAAKNKLEKQVEDLTLRLQLEKRIRVNNYYFQCELPTVIVLFYQTGSLICVKHINQFKLFIVVWSISSRQYLCGNFNRWSKLDLYTIFFFRQKHTVKGLPLQSFLNLFKQM